MSYDKDIVNLYKALLLKDLASKDQENFEMKIKLETNTQYNFFDFVLHIIIRQGRGFSQRLLLLHDFLSEHH